MGNMGWSGGYKTLSLCAGSLVRACKTGKNLDITVESSAVEKLAVMTL